MSTSNCLCLLRIVFGCISQQNITKNIKFHKLVCVKVNAVHSIRHEIAQNSDRARAGPNFGVVPTTDMVNQIQVE